MKSASAPRPYAHALLILSLAAPASLAQKPASTKPAQQTGRPVSAGPPAATPAGRDNAQTRRPAATPAPTPLATQAKTEPESSEVDRTLDEVVGAEDYALYFEVRALGQLARSKDVGDLVDAFRALGAGAKDVEEYMTFFTANAEQLSDVRSVTLALPTRLGLPEFLAAQEFPNAETARAMEPKLRAEADKLARAVTGQPPADASAQQKGTPQAASVKSSAEKSPAPKPHSQSLVMKRFGRLILMSNEPFTLASLRVEESPSLSENGRFQTLRGRLSSEPLFLYFDVGLLRRGMELDREKWEREAAERESATVASAEPTPSVIDVPAPPDDEAVEGEEGGRREIDDGMPEEMSEQADEGDGDETPPPPAPGTGGGQAEMSVEVNGEGRATLEAQTGGTAGMMLGRMLFGGGGGLFGQPQWPEVVAAALDVRDDAFVVRALLVNQAGEFVIPVPFISGLISGPHLVPQAATLAPSDTDIFVSASLDLRQIFLRLLGAATDSFNQSQAERARARGKEGADKKDMAGRSSDAGPPQELTPESALAAAELLMGFKIKDDFIPAFGNEVALSLPGEWFAGSRQQYNAGRGRPKEEAKSAVVFIALNNVAGVQKMLPRVLELIGMKSVAAPDQATTHGGVKIHVYGELAMAYVNNFLVVSPDAASIKRVVDAGTSSGALAFDPRFRDETDWEPKQNLGSVYVSQKVFDQILGEMTKWLDPKDPEVEQTLARLQIRTRAASYAVTDEGGGVLQHELRLPTAVLKLILAEVALQPKVGPVRTPETQALSTLTVIRDAQDSRKQTSGSYGSLDELVPQRKGAPRGIYDYHPLAKKNLEAASYRFELTAAGYRYSVTAVPKDYGKAGRRSFYMDETGVIRAADRAGQPATADDPPVD